MTTTAVSDAEVMDANRLVWIDLEMTGLNVEKARIIEIACIVTEGDLTIVAKSQSQNPMSDWNKLNSKFIRQSITINCKSLINSGPNLVIHQDDELLEGMDEWCTLHHGQSGLTESVRNSTISTEEAEAKVLSFVRQYVPPGKCPLAGNSVGTDKLFLERYMPKLAAHLHYRIVDVSTIKELCRRWYPEDLKKAPAKKLTHRSVLSSTPGSFKTFQEKNERGTKAWMLPSKEGTLLLFSLLSPVLHHLFDVLP
ncbi:small nuclease [Elysia marginata]|uniref:Small nuclease n=1 Tax=Elysia marginata TaxID=1093978 RepID=A0AAV4IDC2_9GAST|nr:small nuclease [Elysia marginata]